MQSSVGVPTSEVIPSDPDLPRQRRTVAGGFAFSAFAIAAVLFSLGRIPAIDAIFTTVDNALRSHNDAIVNTILEFLPLVLVGVGVFGLIYFILGRFYRQRRSA